MAIVYSDNEATLNDVVSIQEVDGLLEWLLANPDASINLSSCVHLHLAALQTLASAHRSVTAWPENDDLRSWIEPLLTTEEGRR